MATETITWLGHSSFRLDAANGTRTSDAGLYVGEPVGFVFRLECATIYFAGDTDVFGDMALIQRLHRPDIAVLPIGDRATMGPRGAALALELLQPTICIPCHYGTWRLLHRHT
jgi:L-ascorbate metabolism protein UlaG (beta-lactamase superfamily)